MLSNDNFSAKVLYCWQLIYVFCVDQQPDPMILNYQLIFSTFQQESKNSVNQFLIANYIRLAYNIPFYLTQIILKRYYNERTGEVSEESFVELMTELNSTDILNITDYIDLFKIYDIDQKHYIKCEKFTRIFYEMNLSPLSRRMIREVLKTFQINPSFRLSFLDFLKIMSAYRVKQHIVFQKDMYVQDMK